MNIKEVMLKYELLYSKYATLDKDAIRIKEYTPDIRPNYFRDIDRIIHSMSYTKYIDKTQVFSLKDNDLISKRIIHVQLVSKIARTIGRALSLNEDLIEAIALGHDLGHVPFGHEGEYILNELSLKYNEGYFNHNVQSVRNLMVIEENGKGKNITIQVLDGILCHNGELELKKYKPKKKTQNEFFNDYLNCYNIENYTKTLVPMTLEGCVVRLSDIIAYLGRDIEDAERLGLFDKDNIPANIKNILGNNNKDIVNNIILNVIKNSVNKSYIALDDDVFNAIKDLKAFNYKHIYKKAHTENELEFYKTMYYDLFEKLLNILEKEDKNHNIYNLYLNYMNSEYQNNTTNARKVIDYIAGMTDDFFIKEYKNYQPIN